MIIFTTSPQRIGRDRPISIPQRKIDLPPNSTPGWNTLDLKFFQQQCSTFKKIRNSRQQGGGGVDEMDPNESIEYGRQA